MEDVKQILFTMHYSCWYCPEVQIRPAVPPFTKEATGMTKLVVLQGHQW